jgi:hypothetical protein
MYETRPAATFEILEEADVWFVGLGGRGLEGPIGKTEEMLELYVFLKDSVLANWRSESVGVLGEESSGSEERDKASNC